MECVNILIVDPSYDMAQFFFRALELRKEYRCFLAHNDFDAISVLNSHPIKLIVADYSLINRDNFKFLRYLKHNFPNIILVIGGYVNQISEVRGLLHKGVHGYFIKPLSVKNFRDIIDSLLKQTKCLP